MIYKEWEARQDVTLQKELTDFEKSLYDRYIQEHRLEFNNNKTAVVILTLCSGFEIVGTAGCAEPSKFDGNLGHLYAMKDALRKLGEMHTFHEAQLKIEAKVMSTKVLTSKALTQEEIDAFRKQWKQDVAVEVDRIMVKHERLIHGLHRPTDARLTVDTVPNRRQEEHLFPRDLDRSPIVSFKEDKHG